MGTGRVGFVGVGLMGHGMAKDIVEGSDGAVLCVAGSRQAEAEAGGLPPRP